MEIDVGRAGVVGRGVEGGARQPAASSAAPPPRGARSAPPSSRRPCRLSPSLCLAAAVRLARSLPGARAAARRGSCPRRRSPALLEFRRQLVDLGRHSARQDHRPHSFAQGGQHLLLQTAHRQHLAGEGYLAGQGYLRQHRHLQQRRQQRRGHGDARRRPFLGHRRPRGSASAPPARTAARGRTAAAARTRPLAFSSGAEARLRARPVSMTPARSGLRRSLPCAGRRSTPRAAVGLLVVVEQVGAPGRIGPQRAESGVAHQRGLQIAPGGRDALLHDLAQLAR